MRGGVPGQVRGGVGNIRAWRKGAKDYFKCSTVKLAPGVFGRMVKGGKVINTVSINLRRTYSNYEKNI